MYNSDVLVVALRRRMCIHSAASGSADHDQDFMRRGQLLDDVGTIAQHRIHIVHGRNDAVCLPRAAARLRSALHAVGAGDNVTLEYVEAAGHSDSEPPIARALRQAADALAREP